jgi:hypothetical protein
MYMCVYIYIYIYIYILHEIRKREANWIGHILRRNCLLQRFTEGKIQGGIEVTGRQWRKRRKLLDDLKERRGYSHLKEEALDRTMWRARFGRGFGPVVRQTTKWMYFHLYMGIFGWTLGTSWRALHEQPCTTETMIGVSQLAFKKYGGQCILTTHSLAYVCIKHFKQWTNELQVHSKAACLHKSLRNG